MSDVTPEAAALLKRARELVESKPEQLAAVRGALARKLEAGAAPSCGELETLGRPGLVRHGRWTLGGKLGRAVSLTLLAGTGVLVLRAAPPAAVPSADSPPAAAPRTAADAPIASVMERAAAEQHAAAPEPAVTYPAAEQSSHPAAIAARPTRMRSSGRPSASRLAARHFAASTPTAPPVAEAAPVATQQPQSAARAADEAPAPDVRDRSAEEQLRPARAPVPQRDLLVREVAMLAGARTALERGNDARALQILDAHAREFPAGALSEEQLALRARALCALGRTYEGRRAVERLAARAPDSPHLKRSQSACGIAE